MNGAATLYEPMHRAPEIGVVREGMLADMVIVDQNPLQNFKVLYANGTVRLNDKTGKVERVGGIKWTIKDGIAYDAKKLAADVMAMVERQKRSKPSKTTASPQ
jgi:adenine deaminase